MKNLKIIGLSLIIIFAAVFVSGCIGEIIEEATDDPNTIEGVKFNTPSGFNLVINNYTETVTDTIYFEKDDSEIIVSFVYTDMNSASEYMKNSSSYYSEVKIGDLTFYKESMWKISIDDFDLDSYDGGTPNGATYYSQYVFDFKGKIFSISIDDDIPDHEKILKEILGI